MNLRRTKLRLRKSLAERSVAGTAFLLLKKAVQALWPRAPWRRGVDVPPKSYASVHPFDEQFGVETSGFLRPEDLYSGYRNDLFNTGYFGIAPSVFRQIFARLGAACDGFTFVDLGSGKGRALLLASEYPFREVVGVELSPQLHRTACANILRYRSPARLCERVRSVEGDATGFSFPPGPLVVYMWNAFEEPVFQRVLQNLESSLRQDPREVYVLYVHPELDRLLEGSPLLYKLWTDEFELNEEDYAAHAFPPRCERCVAYRSEVQIGCGERLERAFPAGNGATRDWRKPSD